MTDTPVRDAATLVLVRRDTDTPRILMGQRGANAVFMPNKFVFPGGRLDAADHDVTAADTLSPEVLRPLTARADPALAPALAITAIRELWEETGLRLGRPGDTSSLPPAWSHFATAGLLPSPAALSFIFRAITPPGRPRRFDARFFLAEAAAIVGDPDDFSQADDELSHLQWIPLDQARSLDLPFITEIVLAELQARLTDPTRPIPFFDQSAEYSQYHAL